VQFRVLLLTPPLALRRGRVQRETWGQLKSRYAPDPGTAQPQTTDRQAPPSDHRLPSPGLSTRRVEGRAQGASGRAPAEDCRACAARSGGHAVRLVLVSLTWAEEEASVDVCADEWSHRVVAFGIARLRRALRSSLASMRRWHGTGCCFKSRALPSRHSPHSIHAGGRGPQRTMRNSRSWCVQSRCRRPAARAPPLSDPCPRIRDSP